MSVPIDPAILHELILGVASNGIWSFLANRGTRAARAVKAVRRQSGKSVADIYTVAAADVCDEFCRVGSIEWARLKGYLTSPDVESVVRQVYAASIIDKGKPSYIDAIREEFVASLAAALDVSASAAERVGNSIFTAIFRECERHLDNAIRLNVLSAHEAKSSARYTRLLGEITAVTKNLEILRATTKPDIAAFVSFERQYRTQVGLRHW